MSREQAESRRRCDRERCALLAQVGALEAELQEQLSRQQEAARQASELCALRQQVESLDKHLRSQRQFMDVSVPVRVDGLGALPCSWAGARRSWRRRSRLSPVATARIPTPGLSSRARHLPSGGRPACHRKGRPPRPAALPQCPAGAVSTQRTRVSCGSSGPAWEGERAAASGPVPLLYPSRPSRVPFRGRGRDQGAMSPRATRTVCVSRQEQAVEREHEREEFQQEVRRLEEQLRRAARPQPWAPSLGDVSRPRRPRLPRTRTAAGTTGWEARGPLAASCPAPPRVPLPGATCLPTPVRGSGSRSACSSLYLNLLRGCWIHAQL